MTDNTVRVDEMEKENSTDDVSDEAMEAAAGMWGDAGGIILHRGPVLSAHFRLAALSGRPVRWKLCWARLLN